MNKKLKGDLSELHVILALTNLGYQVSIPFGDRARYDLIVDAKNKLLKIQVKTGRIDDKGNIRIPLSSKGYHGNRKLYTKEEIDLILAYVDGIIYIIRGFEGKTEIRLRTQPVKNNQIKGVNLAKDYIFTEL